MKVKVNGQIVRVSALLREDDGSISGYRNRKLVVVVSNPANIEIIVNIREIDQ